MDLNLTVASMTELGQGIEIILFIFFFRVKKTVRQSVAKGISIIIRNHGPLIQPTVQPCLGDLVSSTIPVGFKVITDTEINMFNL
jgi:hypothetical protein